MKILLIIASVVLIQTMFVSCGRMEGQTKEESKDEIKLPAPKKSSKVSLEETLARRRSVRQFKPDELTVEEISQLFWAGDGLNADVKQRTNRTAPSAGAIYPVELYAVTKDGVYHYRPEPHSLKLVKKEDMRQDLARSAFGQGWVAVVPLNIIITGDYQKCTKRYRDRARRYVDIEVGHIAQNIHLQAVALNLGSVPIGAFDDDSVREILQIPEAETPLYIIPVGHPEK